ncbi:signal recognition particle-docking protein FtsY [uncultured Amphritea sp.]|uniref:signal recognition particle-docking protein FtsY n=1 Tax=uncultured Amphritea sp. TaxID=981605 RepID=UPI0025F09920|nr:signal recognition particle-docking protein FtsY [uncultured Amphritea sp.]
MFKKLKSIFTSEKDDAQKALPEENGTQPEVSEQLAVEPADIGEVDNKAQEMLAVDAREDEVALEDEVPDAEAVQDDAAAEPEPLQVAEAEAEAVPDTETAPVAEPEPEQKTGFFGRIKAGLSRTKANLTEGLGDLFLGAKQIDDELLEEIETQLLLADVDVAATTEIIGRLTERVKRKQLADSDALYTALKDELASLLDTAEQPIDFSQSKGPFVLLMVGVNGVGKTTTIGKLAKKYQAEGKSVMLAAGDTFRAAAVEQLQVWGDRNNVPVVAQHTGADSASVLYDALQSAQAKNIDVLIADTAGRLQNKDNLMQELEKVVRVMKKLDPEAPHEVMLVLDAGTGQNAMSQAKLFKEAVGVSGISLTKLDGTAKGGIIFAIAKQLDLPIRYIGVGEQVDDLRPFKAKEFVTALFD